MELKFKENYLFSENNRKKAQPADDNQYHDDGEWEILKGEHLLHGKAFAALINK